MILYSQRDSRWRNKEFAPGYNFGGFGHFTTCIAMIASLAGYTDTPPEVAKKLQTFYMGRFLTHPECIPEVYPSLTWAGKIDWRGASTDLKQLKAELSTGPTILSVSLVPGGARVPRDQHYVIGKTLNKHDLDIIDPWTGTHCRLLERYAVDNWDIKDAILQALLLRVDLKGNSTRTLQSP